MRRGIGPGMTLVGLALIAGSLWFNVWSQKQKAIDDLAGDIAWAHDNLLQRPLVEGADVGAARAA